MAPKGKKKAAAAASTSQDKPAGETALGDKPYMGFGQYAGEGPMFFVKQFSGLVVAAIGVLIMVSSYSEDYNFVPLDPTGTMWVALVIMMIGLGLHELRPWKVRRSVCAIIAIVQ
jgi:hypothetical protein